MLTIELIDDLFTLRCPGSNAVWVFDRAAEARRFIRAFFAQDIRSL